MLEGQRYERMSSGFMAGVMKNLQKERRRNGKVGEKVIQ